MIMFDRSRIFIDFYIFMDVTIETLFHVLNIIIDALF